jgi:hypothetical protein
LGYWLIRAWGRRMVVWMESYRRFPPFGAIGALPFPPNDPQARARTVRRTVQILRTEPAALLLFLRATLHGDTERLLPFQRSLHWLACRVPQAMLLPLAIHIEPSYHQYPRAYLSVGAPFQSASTDETAWLAEAAGAVETLLRQTRADARAALTDDEHTLRRASKCYCGARARFTSGSERFGYPTADAFADGAPWGGDDAGAGLRALPSGAAGAWRQLLLRDALFPARNAPRCPRALRLRALPRPVGGLPRRAQFAREHPHATGRLRARFDSRRVRRACVAAARCGRSPMSCAATQSPCATRWSFWTRCGWT